MKKLLILAMTILAICAGGIFAITTFISQKANFETCSSNNPCDAVVAISGGNTDLRAIYAAQILDEVGAKNLVFSGANSSQFIKSDARRMSEIAQSHGASQEKITLEENARNTEQNAQLTAKIIKQNGWRRVVLVTSPYHQRRAFLEFSKALQGANVEIFNAPAKIDPDWRASTWFLSPRGWYLTMAEFVGIIRFYLR